MADPTLSAVLTQNNLDISILATVTTGTAPFIYTIDYDDGVTDSFTTSSTTHTFTHTYLDTTLKTIKVQARTGAAGVSNAFTSPVSDGGVWTVNATSVSGYIVSAAGSGTTRFKPPATLGYYMLRQDQGNATLNLTWDYRSLTNNTTDGITFGFDPTTGSGYTLLWNQSSSFNGGLTLRRSTSDTSSMTALADATGNPLPVNWGSTGWGGTTAHFTLDYNSTTGVIAAGFGLGVTPTNRINYTDSSPLVGTWWGPIEFVNNQGNGKWFNLLGTTASTLGLSNIVLLYPTWVSSSATFGSNRIGFRSPSNRRTL